MKKRGAKILVLLSLFLMLTVNFGFAENTDSTLNAIIDFLKYDRAIHIMAMLIAGFGFLMVFVKGYGRSALTATYLLVSLAIPVYIAIAASGIFGHKEINIDSVVLAEFAAASLLICAGAVLGRLKMHQYLVLGLLFTVSYMVNEWIVLGNGLGLISRFVDTGGSVVIHAFGALFGLGVLLTMTTKAEFEKHITADATSDRFSMVGSMVLWIFWPSFCAALVTPALVPATILNVILALCGATLATYLFSILLRKKIAISDIANAALAGGVAIGSTCDSATPVVAIVIGVLAGVLSTVGFAVIHPALMGKLKKVDTCGVLNLHGWPGLLGGLVALIVVQGINWGNQLAGIGITIAIAVLAGFLTGKIVSLFGRRSNAYEDAEEFIDV
jgi:ammonium transporter Rh